MTITSLLGEVVTSGRLPLDLPSSMRAVEASAFDAPFDTAGLCSASETACDRRRR